MIKQIIILLIFICLEPIKRCLSLALYPLIYPFRAKLRTDEILWATYLFKPKVKLLWFILNDSEKMKYGVEYANQDKYYPTLFWVNGEFLRSYYFNAIRNSFVNWNNWVAFKLGRKVKCLKRYGSINNFIELRQFTNGKRLYCEFYLGSKWQQFGWISCGRFEIDLLKDREKK